MSAVPSPSASFDGAAVRTSRLDRAGALRSWLSYYRPGLRQSEHTHHAPHLSLVLAGSFREATPHAERTLYQGCLGIRADAARHAVEFGPAGALILSVELPDGGAGGTGRDGVRWLSAPTRAGRDLLVPLSAGSSAQARQALDQLLRCSAGRMPPAEGWLERAAARLIAAPDALTIAELSRSSGIHRAHFARAFRRRYGMPPSRFRRAAMIARSLAALERDAGLADAAACGGFADQSHLSRAMRDCCGLSPGRIRDLLPEATSVQDGRKPIP